MDLGEISVRYVAPDMADNPGHVRFVRLVRQQRSIGADNPDGQDTLYRRVSVLSGVRPDPVECRWEAHRNLHSGLTRARTHRFFPLSIGACSQQAPGFACPARRVPWRMDAVSARRWHLGGQRSTLTGELPKAKICRRSSVVPASWQNGGFRLQVACTV